MHGKCYFMLICLQCTSSHSVSYTFWSKVPAITSSTVDLVILVTTRGRVQSLVTRAARETRLVPRLVSCLELLSKVDCLLALGTNVATSPPGLGTWVTCRR